MYRNTFLRFFAEIWLKNVTSRDGCVLLSSTDMREQEREEAAKASGHGCELWASTLLLMQDYTITGMTAKGASPNNFLAVTQDHSDHRGRATKPNASLGVVLPYDSGDMLECPKLPKKQNKSKMGQK